MFINHTVTSFRNIIRQKGYTLINILGLAIGMASCILILIWVQDELSFDRHFPNAKNIYRVAVKGIVGEQEMNGAQTSSLMAATLVNEYPEVLSATRMQHTPNMLIRYEDRTFNENNFMWVDSNFFDIFQIPLVYGNQKTALKDDHTVVMTMTSAGKFFDDPSQAIGKIVTYEDGTPYRVSGIVEDPHANSHFHYGMMSPLSSWEWNWEQFWLNNFMYTYITIHEQADPKELENKLPEVVKKYVAPHIRRATNMSLEEFYESGGGIEFYLQPITDIHLHSHIDGEIEPNSDIKYVYIFSLTALFILVIACINFMNLSTSRSVGRSKEVGMRKVLGSTRSRLIFQFITESVIMCLTAAIISVILIQLALPVFNSISGKGISIGYFRNWYIIPGIVLFAVIVGLLSGSYPAFLLASFQPVTVLKGTLTSGTRGLLLRNILVVLQFTISVTLIICTSIMFKQLHYIQNKRLGFQKENIVVIKRGWAIGQKPDGTLIETPPGETVIDAFKNDLLNNPHVQSVTGSTHLPGHEVPNAIFHPKNAPEEHHPINYCWTDYDFKKTYDLELMEGMWFSRDMSRIWEKVIINDAAAKALGYEPPYVGKTIGIVGGHTINVIGVVKDYHYESLHKPINPLIIAFQNMDRTYISVRISPVNINETIKYIEDTWHEYIPYKPFEYYFFDENYQNLYNTEKRIGKLFTAFSILAIFIACLGLFGLAAFTTERRTKEIGIRKAIGASSSAIIMLLIKEFIKWVAIANIIAWPVAYFTMSSWLNNYSYRTAINLLPFIIAGMLSLTIASLTVGFHSLKASLANPADTLHYE